MRVFKSIAILSVLGLLLAACGSSRGALANPEVTTTDGESENTGGTAWLTGQSREDAQGAVTVVITGMSVGADSIDFDVVMDTHSVNLDMDLSTLATLTTDRGTSVTASVWSTSESGHHVSGTLSFPAKVGGVSILDGISTLTLTIRNVDAVERIFSWNTQS